MSNPARAARRHGPRTKGSLVVAYCRPENVDGMFCDALAGLLLHDREHGQHIDATIGSESGPRIGRARCEVVHRFLDHCKRHPHVEWLYWLDTDMVPPADIIERSLAHANSETHPIVGGLCFAGGRTKVQPTIYVIANNEEGRIESESILQYPASALIEVGGTGSACLLIHRSVFEKIQTMMDEGAKGKHPLPWYQDVIIDNKDWGEDLVFCLRARAVGARIWIDTGIKVGHRKKWTIDERAFLQYAHQLDQLAAEQHVEFTDETMPDVEILPVLSAVP